MIADSSLVNTTIHPGVSRWADGRGLSHEACNAVASLALARLAPGDLLTFCEAACQVGPAAVVELLTAGVLTIVENPCPSPLSDDCHLFRLEAAEER